MSNIQIGLLGSFSITIDSGTQNVLISKGAMRLAAFLAMAEGRAVLREQVAGALWGDLAEERARKALNTELWRIRKVMVAAGLRPDGLIESDKSSLKLAGDAQAVDAVRFMRLLKDQVGRQSVAPDTVRLSQLSQAIELYRGDFLEGHYDDWVLQQRSYLCGRYQAALNMLLSTSMQRKKFGLALDIGDRLLAFDPLQEHVHRQLIKCHTSMGDRVAALRQFQKCEAQLHAELGVDPMEETVAAIDACFGTGSCQPSGISTEPNEVLPNSHQTHLRKAVLQLDLARTSLDRAMGE